VTEILAARAGMTIAALRAGMLPYPGTKTGDSWLLSVGRLGRRPQNEEAGWIQYCPACLAEDRTPYFRRRWRLVVSTCCPRHGVILADRCPVCGGTLNRGALRADCCGRPLAEAPSTVASPLGLLVQRWLDDRLHLLGMSAGHDVEFALMQKLSSAMRRAASACWVRPGRVADMMPVERHVILPWVADRETSASELQAHVSWLRTCGGRLLRECADLHDRYVRQEIFRGRAAERKVVAPVGSSALARTVVGGPGRRSGKRKARDEFQAYWQKLFNALPPKQHTSRT
jgi:hypothetical protein